MVQKQREMKRYASRSRERLLAILLDAERLISCLSNAPRSSCQDGRRTLPTQLVNFEGRLPGPIWPFMTGTPFGAAETAEEDCVAVVVGSVLELVVGVGTLNVGRERAAACGADADAVAAG